MPTFSLNITSRSFEATSDHAYLTIHPGMAHGHRAGWRPSGVPEIYAFADHFLKGAPLAPGRITHQPSEENVKLVFESEVPIESATVHYLNEPLTYRKSDTSDKHARPGPWLELAAEIDSANQTVTTRLSASCVTYYVNLTDARGHLISSALIELE